MSEPTAQLIALLIYPGLLSTLVITIIISWLTHMHTPGGGLSRGLVATWRGQGSLAVLCAALLPLIIAGLLPWPGSPVPWTPGYLWLIWAGLEASYLLASLPGLYHHTPTGVRAAMREAQMNAWGRLLVWASIGVSRWIGDWTLMYLPAQGLVLVAALLALPVAVGWGAFAPSNDITPGGAEAGLSRAAYEMAAWGRAIRVTVMLMLIPVLMLPPIEGIPLGFDIALIIVTILSLAALGRAINGHMVRRPILEALWLSWVRTVPLLVAAIVLLLVLKQL